MMAAAISVQARGDRVCMLRETDAGTEIALLPVDQAQRLVRLLQSAIVVARANCRQAQVPQ